MDKFNAVYKNEMLKMLRKKSVWVISIIMVVIMLLASLVMWLMSTDIATDISTEEMCDMYIEGYQSQIKELNNKLNGKTGEDITDTRAGEELYDIFREIERYEAYVEYYKLCKEYNVKQNYTNRYYRDILLSEVRENDFRISLYNNVIKKYGLEKISFCEYDILTSEEVAEIQSKREPYIKIVAENDFAAYIDMKNQEILADEFLDETQKKIELENNRLILEGNLTGEYASHATTIDSLLLLTKYKQSIESGIDYVSMNGNAPLLPSEIQKYKEEAAIMEYKIECGYYNIGQETNRIMDFDSISLAQVLLSISTSFILILIIMLAGSIISTEMANGSVKVLVVAPVKRWKIFTAKCAALLTVAMSLWFITSVIAILMTGVMMGFNSLLPYVYYGAGAAASISFIPYIMLYSLTTMVQIIFYGSLALMLSALTRNTAVSIGVALGGSYMISGITSIVALLVNARWIKYIPTVCVSSFANLVFPTAADSEMQIITQGITGMLSSGINAWFAAIYIAVLVFAMIFTARDAFCRRDIK